MNPDEGYVVTTGFEKTQNAESDDTELEDFDEPDEEMEDTKSKIGEFKPRRKQLRFRGVTDKLIQQRQSPAIAEWMKQLARP
jgi:hypothetical protein